MRVLVEKSSPPGQSHGLGHVTVRRHTSHRRPKAVMPNKALQQTPQTR
jgi:hypothetical protein